MSRGLLVAALLIAVSGCSTRPVEPHASTYVDSRTCASCHAAIAKTFSETAMAQAFLRVSPASMSAKGILGRYEHPASGRTYEVVERGGRYFQTRSARGFNRTKDYFIEREIHYVMGSGRHALTFIHRTPQGRLTQLPLGWYPERGGSLAMSPGYDRAAPMDFRRKISFDCMFCHNAYPDTPPGTDAPALEPVFPASLPEGIDCQRCHGPGSLHVSVARRGGAKSSEIKAAIVNPARLGAERAMEVCMQCHLETTSTALPNATVRFGRGAFSFRPGEPLGDFMIHFDHAKGSGREEKFEIVSSVYRLRQSRCFIASAGKLSCTTCHNPHDVPRGQAAAVSYAKACRSCHADLSGGPHAESNADCASCHMPKRRTEDVVHAVMTDHKIVRRPPPGNLLAPRQEVDANTYSGKVVLYYPPDARSQELYLAAAQVLQKSNLRAGIPRLQAYIDSQQPKEPLIYVILGQAYQQNGDLAQAESLYREAIKRGAGSVPMRLLGEQLRRQGRAGEALEILQQARALAPADAGVLYALGLVLRELGRGAEAVSAMEAAISHDADFPEAQNSLGGMLLELGDRARAETSLREALRQQPDFAEAHGNLGQLLSLAGDYPQAEFHAREAIRLKPANLQAWQTLGDLQSARGEWAQARKSYNEVLRVRPADQAAHLGLGTAQAAAGELAAARANLDQAASGENAAIRQEALDLLNQLR